MEAKIKCTIKVLYLTGQKHFVDHNLLSKIKQYYKINININLYPTCYFLELCKAVY